MTEKRLLRGIIPLMMLVLLVACGGGGESDEAAAGPTSTPSPAERLVTTDISGENEGIEGGDRLLAWIGSAIAPGQQSANSPGQIVFIDGNGRIDPVMDAPTGTSRVHACGRQATSLDGRYFAFFVGGDDGTLYLMDGTRAPREVRDMSAMGCADVSTLQFTPDGQRFAYIDFAPDAPSSNFARGFLYVYESDDVEQLIRVDNVSAFDVSASALAYVGVFADADGNASEAGVSIWPYDGEPDEITTLFADSGCQFTSGQLVYTGADSLAALMGQRCSGNGTSWELYTIEITAGTASRVTDGNLAGSFLSYARTNSLLAQVDGGIVYYTLPDGLTANTVTVRSALLDSPEESDDLVVNGIMPRYNNRPYDPDTSAHPVISPDGQWAAIASQTANGAAAVNVMDLADPEGFPFDLRAGNGIVVSMAFTPDSGQLVYVAGASDGGDNSLFSLDLARGVEDRIARGHFVEVIPAPDNLAVAVSTWAFPDDPNQPMYMTLDVVSLADGEISTLATGATITSEGRVTDRHFIYPLSWRG